MKYIYNQNFIPKKEKDRFVLFNNETKNIYDLNEFGYEIVEMLMENIPIFKIKENFKQMYNEDSHIIEKEIDSFLNDISLLKVIDLINSTEITIKDLEFVEGIDVNSYLKLRDLVGWEKICFEQAEKGLNNSFYIISCKYNNEIIASSRVLWDGGYTAFIVDVMVNPIWQRKKIGSKMMELIEEKLYNSLNEGDKLMINLYSSKTKFDFYNSLGYSKGLGFIKWVNN